RLLGDEHHAAHVVQDSTARTATAVQDLLDRVGPAAAANARAEAAELTEVLRREHPDATVEPWDWAYCSRLLMQERYALDDAVLRPYLELGRVVHDGVFHAATALYGLTFTRREDLRGYHPDVEVYEVHDADGSPAGLFLADWYARPTKEGGAWMHNLVDQSHLLGHKAVVVNNLNITRPADGRPTLLTWDEVITAFHEFGHALHGLLSDVRLPSQSGTEVPRDFVEFPSQVNEMWAWDPAVLARFAVHHVTGEPMPSEWVQTLASSQRFGQGHATTEYLGAALLDQAWHRHTPEDLPTTPEAVADFERAVLQAAGLDVPGVTPRYRSTYFKHVFGGGYAAEYYSYLWSAVLDADTVAWFTENGGLKRSNGDRFRRALLSRGGSCDVMEAFTELRGRGPDLQPLLTRRGLA
ncbi:dipeptidyl carboxypeptidase II, partial [Cellulomonas bogoriensis 69B4 = DSM 16987]